MSEITPKKLNTTNPFELKQRYEFYTIATTLDVFEGLVPNNYVFDELNFLSKLDKHEELQVEPKVAHLDGLDEDDIHPIESLNMRGEMTLVTFFSLQMVDIPKPFSRAKSLYRSTSSMPRLRFLNMLTRHGKRSKTSKAYAFALGSVSQQYSNLSKLQVESED